MYKPVKNEYHDTRYDLVQTGLVKKRRKKMIFELYSRNMFNLPDALTNESNIDSDSI